ncbi:MAG: hypothetical protein DDT32_02247 [Syntrophomonadaceae bacterium]|nr:hypothetical protein [Bacillota bacterium]
MESKNTRPSVPPRISSQQRSGWGIIPSTFPSALVIPAMLEREPLGLAALLVIFGVLVIGGGAAAVLVKQRKQKFSEGRRAVTEAVCPQCGTANSVADNFCQNCGAGLKALVITCSKCGAENPPEVKFCSQCGVEMSDAQ